MTYNKDLEAYTKELATFRDELATFLENSMTGREEIVSQVLIEMGSRIARMCLPLSSAERFVDLSMNHGFTCAEEFMKEEGINDG